MTKHYLSSGEVVLFNLFDGNDSILLPECELSLAEATALAQHILSVIDSYHQMACPRCGQYAPVSDRVEACSCGSGTVARGTGWMPRKDLTYGFI